MVTATQILNGCQEVRMEECVSKLIGDATNSRKDHEILFI